MPNDEILEEKRKFVRVPFNEAIRVKREDGEQIVDTLAYDVSHGGIKLNTFEFIPVNSPVTVEVKLQNQSKLVSLSGKVVWIKELPASERFQIGIQFDGPDVFSKSELGKFIFSNYFYPSLKDVELIVERREVENGG